MSNKLIAVLALSLCGATAAHAMADPPSNWWHHQWHHHEHRGHSEQAAPPATAAPEIDPASAIGGLTLLLGGLAVIRGRRGKR